VTPELHRPVAVAEIGPSGLESMVEASLAECAALARRMGVPAVLSLFCEFHLARGVGGAVAARGRLVASVVQTCVVSLDDFETEVAEDFRVRFVPAGTESDNPDPEAEDEIPFAGAVIDLGEAAAEQLALALDPYPRKPGAELPENEPVLRTRH
jgi:Large ribosomal RNA subunit accumulation protein YceD